MPARNAGRNQDVTEDNEMALSDFRRARELAVFGDAQSILDRKIALLSSSR